MDILTDTEADAARNRALVTTRRARDDGRVPDDFYRVDWDASPEDKLSFLFAPEK